MPIRLETMTADEGPGRADRAELLTGSAEEASLPLGERRLNILFLIPSLRGGGAERVMVTLLQHVNRARFKPVLAVVDSTDSVYLADVPEDVQVIHLNSSRVRYAIPRVMRLIWQMKPDVVLSTLGHLNLALAMVRPFLPSRTLFVAREATIVSQNVMAHRPEFVWRWLYRKFYSNHDILVCQSRHMRDDLVSSFCVPADRTVVINNPVDLPKIRHKAALAAAPWPWPAQAGRTRLLAAGRLSAEKGFDILIRAMELIADPGVCLAIIGDGPLRQKLQDQIARAGLLDRVHLLGFQANPYSWFRSADALVISSRYEGFPNVVLESLACGTPVIGLPGAGGTREILENVPECLLAADMTAEALAEALRQWLSGPKARVADAALIPYAIPRILSQYESTLRTGFERRA